MQVQRVSVVAVICTLTCVRVDGCTRMRTYMCSRGVHVCEREGAQVQRTCVHTMQVCIMVYMPCITLRLGPGDARSCSRDTHRMRITPRKSSGEYIHNRQQIHDVADSAESFIGPSIARISYGYRTDVRGMYGGCTGDVRGMYGGCTARYRTDTVRIPYGYHGSPPSAQTSIKALAAGI